VYPANNNISVISHGRRWGLLLCALLILVSQLFIQLHSIEHLSDPDDETCEICLSGGALEYAVASTVQDVYVKSDGKTALPAPVINANSTRHLSYRPRAPPLLNTNV